MPTLSNFEEEFKKLNERQREVVETTEGPVMVIAGPGTGKTQVLGLRVANILKKNPVDISPNNILCLTYTDAGSINMRERLSRFIGTDAYRVGIYTFHSFCNSVISRYPEYFYNAATYSPADDVAQSEVFDEIFSTLPYGHPLGGPGPDGGYVYKSAIVSRIGNIKTGGYSPSEYKNEVEKYIAEIDDINQVLEKWPTPLSSKKLDAVVEILNDLYALSSSYGNFLAKSLTVAIEQARDIGKTKPIGDWRDKYFEAGDNELKVLKDSNRIERLRAVADMYEQYENMLHSKALYDYADMIIDVRLAIEENSVLRNALEEQYQYILVDEFQDTNEAQLRLVVELSSNKVHEGKPNVMVVGDDDQAIFKFQGAEISNIASFTKLYKDVKNIVLDTNYRSHSVILEATRKIVLQGAYRLEKELGITKELSQGNAKITDGSVEYKEYNSDISEYGDVAKRIKKLIDGGENPEEIAVIANKHQQLKDFIPYLDNVGIPYSYIKKASVFDEPHVKELITVCEYLASVNSDGPIRDDLLPLILSYKCFGINRSALFRISVLAKSSHKSWSETMLDLNDNDVQKAFGLLSILGGDSPSVPLEKILDEYMKESSFRTYYFGKNVLEEKPSQYVTFLASLKTFIEALRNYREGEVLYVKDVAPFVKLYKDHSISLISSSPFVKGGKSVQVMTAHKSKGLEFGSVFVIGAHEKVWAGKSRPNIAPVPSPMAPLITPAGNDEDDFIRILYVALTRAKHTLFVSGHEKLVKYLGAEGIAENDNPKTDEEINDAIGLHEQVLSLVEPPIVEDEKAVLREVLKDYRMPVTHLNNFLDVTSGGPQYFLEQNLLAFPQPMNVAAVFGSAIDKALTEAVRYPKYNAGEEVPLDRLISVFKKELAKARLPKNEAKKQIDKGEEVLTLYMIQRKGSFGIEDESQVDFRNEGVVIESAPLTGKIDLLKIEDGTYKVIDFKTGKASNRFEAKGSDAYEKIKLHKYSQQLMFYKLLIENSSRRKIPVTLLALEFVESAKDGEIIQLPYYPSVEEMERLKKLIGIVYSKIMNLDFPDVSNYDQTLKGIIQFEEDLINGVV